jgi:hypothetical protein
MEGEVDAEADKVEAEAEVEVDILADKDMDVVVVAAATNNSARSPRTSRRTSTSGYQTICTAGPMGRR